MQELKNCKLLGSYGTIKVSPVFKSLQYKQMLQSHGQSMEEALGVLDHRGASRSVWPSKRSLSTRREPPCVWGRVKAGAGEGGGGQRGEDRGLIWGSQGKPLPGKDIYGETRLIHGGQLGKARGNGAAWEGAQPWNRGQGLQSLGGGGTSGKLSLLFLRFIYLF